MKILVNGESREIAGSRLTDALDELGLSGAVVATAVNDEFVAADSRATLRLSEGDRLEVLAPMQGG
jgi:sulfur carrier protein